VAFVVRREEKEKNSSKEEEEKADLAAFVEARLARYKVPRDFVFVESLPRTPYGKVVKGELRSSYLSKNLPSKETR